MTLLEDHRPLTRREKIFVGLGVFAVFVIVAGWSWAGLWMWTRADPTKAVSASFSPRELTAIASVNPAFFEVVPTTTRTLTIGGIARELVTIKCDAWDPYPPCIVGPLLQIDITMPEGDTLTIRGIGELTVRSDVPQPGALPTPEPAR